jgi:ABC-2 type transport system permease protein
MTELFRVFLSTIVTRGRVAGLLALGAVAVLSGLAIGAGEVNDKLESGTQLIANLGLSLVAPIVALTFASAVLGDPNEDGTLVYLWLRPVERWKLAAAGNLAALTIAAPVVVVPMTIAAALTRAGSELTVATVIASVVATLAYTGVFTWLGLRIRRATAWGLAYILVWEGFVARAGGGAGFLSIRSHTESLLSRLADGPRSMQESTTATAIVVPILAAAIAGYLTVRRLQRQDVA